MSIYRALSLTLLTASLTLCGFANAEDGTATAVTSPDPTPTGQDAAGAPAKAPPDITVDTTSYIWFAGQHGNLSAFGYNLGTRASVGDLISHADFGIMQFVGVKYHRVVVLFDFYWYPATFNKISTVASQAPTIGQLPVIGQLPAFQTPVTAQVKYTQVELAPEVGFRLIDHPMLKIDGLTGFRYWYNGVTLNLSSAQHFASGHVSNNYTDPLIGSRITVPLSPKMTAVVWGDVGGFGAGSQLEYQIVGGLVYRLRPKIALNLGWRYNYISYKYPLGLLTNNNAYSGFVVGIAHRWIGAE